MWIVLSFRGLFVGLLTLGPAPGRLGSVPAVGLLFGCWILRLRLWPLPGSVFHLVALALWFAA